MEMLATSEFWGGLFAIIWINLLLSGDNAVVIALAARSLPPKQKKQAVIWGSAAAIAMRVALMILAVELLKLPFLKIVGGLLLLWIAIQLLTPGAGNGSAGIKDSGNLGATIRTIMFADLVMSLDNVIGVVAAANGNLVLLVLGVAIGIPLIVFSSTLVLKVMDRFPLLITLGAGLLGYIAGEMLITDPAVAGWVEGNAHWLRDIMPGPLEFSAAGIAGAVAVVIAGKLLAARTETGKIVDLMERRGRD
ncbi:MAG TPA: TerC family protein [Burkholderiales bacterium]|nr:TerC family protein [Burkholderiales bacterium]